MYCSTAGGPFAKNGEIGYMQGDRDVAPHILENPILYDTKAMCSRFISRYDLS